MAEKENAKENVKQVKFGNKKELTKVVIFDKQDAPNCNIYDIASSQVEHNHSQKTPLKPLLEIRPQETIDVSGVSSNLL